MGNNLDLQEIQITEPEEIEIQGLHTVRMELGIIGTRPLQVHRQPYLEKGKKQPEYTDREAFEASMYYFSDGRHGFPAKAIKACAVNAGRFLPTKMTEIRGMFFVEAEEDGLVEILNPIDPGLPPVPEMKKGMIKTKQGTSIPYVRAMYPEWKIRFFITYVKEFAELAIIMQTIQVGGLFIGLGARRPERSGNNDYGTFIPETAMEV